MAGTPPVATYQLGNIKCAVWEKLNTKGDIMQSFTFQKSYRSADGKYGNTTFFNPQDLSLLITLANKIVLDSVKIKGSKSDLPEGDPTQAPVATEEDVPF